MNLRLDQPRQPLAFDLIARDLVGMFSTLGDLFAQQRASALPAFGPAVRRSGDVGNHAARTIHLHATLLVRTYGRQGQFIRRIVVGLGAAVLINAVAIIAAKADIRITSDPGGNLQTYQAAVESVRRSGEKVIIDGACNSACTLWLSLPASQICVTPRAVFGFHAATNSDTGLPNPSATDALWHSYPARVQIAIGKRGGLWINTIYVPGREVARGCR